MPAARPLLPLKRKLETALLSYLETATSLKLQGWGFFHGAFAGARTLPRVVVHVENAEPAFPGGLPNWCQTTVYALSAIDAETTGGEGTEEAQDQKRADAELKHDEAMQLIEAAMQDGEALQAHVNKVNTVSRPVPDFYLYEAVEAGQGTDIENRQFGNGLRYRVLCEPQDN
jgi:hypothetical protein